MTSFLELSALCERLENIGSKKSKISRVADFLQKLDPNEIEWAVRFIIGAPLLRWDQRKLDVKYATLVSLIKNLTGTSDSDFLETFNKTGDLGCATKMLFEKLKGGQLTFRTKPLTIEDVHEFFEKLANISGPRSRSKKEHLVRALLLRASPLEAKYIVKNIEGSMRHGFSEGFMEEAISKAFGISKELVSRAHMLISDLGMVAKMAAVGGQESVKRVRVSLFHPVRPMLAETIDSVKEALREHGGITCFEYKLDGARVQIHKNGDKIRVFSRHVRDITHSLPELVEIVKSEVKAHSAILEGEVIAVGSDGKPLPFQYLMRRFRRMHEVHEKAKEIPVAIYFFDILYYDNRPLVDQSLKERREVLTEVVDESRIVRSLITDNVKKAEKFLESSISEGHEGLVAKRLSSIYTPGARGKQWLKVKKTPDTLDLVIIAAEYGHGYRHRWLSDYYLAARSENGFEIIGKTFTGLTDEEIEFMTRRLEELAIAKKGRKVLVKPEIVVEVAFSNIQKSPHYRSGYALRFARITRIRDDKSPSDADTIERVKELYRKQFKHIE